MCSSCEVIKTESTGKRPLSLTHPHLMDEWDFVKNGEVRPEYLTAGSHVRVRWYHIAEDGQIHEWEAYIFNRTRKKNPSGCPYCSGNLVGCGNDLKTNFPELAKQWHPIKNGSLLPEHVTPGSDKKVHWCHEKDGVLHEWEACIKSRTNEKNSTGCPYCENQKVGYGNDLKSMRPEIAKEWHPTKNGSLLPEHVTPGSNKKAHWYHEKDGVPHEWEAYIGDRTNEKNPTGCPRCAMGSISEVSQKWLDLLGIEEREYKLPDFPFRVDGFDLRTNTVFEFLGDYWHGNPEVFNLKDINRRVKKSFGILYEETLERFSMIKKAGYNLVFIWESDFRKQCNNAG